MEEQRERVERVAKMYLCDYPIMLDNDNQYWKALDIIFWPSYFLVDRSGNIVKNAYGEMRKGFGRTDKFEEALAELISQ